MFKNLYEALNALSFTVAAEHINRSRMEKEQALKACNLFATHGTFTQIDGSIFRAPTHLKAKPSKYTT